MSIDPISSNYIKRKYIRVYTLSNTFCYYVSLDLDGLDVVEQTLSYVCSLA